MERTTKFPNFRKFTEPVVSDTVDWEACGLG